MKYRMGWIIFLFHICTALYSQDKQEESTLLWRISGNGLSKTSYLFGTLHSLCRKDAELSDSLLVVIKTCEKVYLEINQADRSLMKRMQSLMKMKNDTTLADLLNKEDYDKLKSLYKKNDQVIPYATLKAYKPYLAYNFFPLFIKYCKGISMEHLIIRHAQKNSKPITGLETIEEYTAIFDSLSYKTQAEELVRRIDVIGKPNEVEAKKIWDIYESQSLQNIENWMQSMDIGLPGFLSMLYYNRNRKWIKQLEEILFKRSLLVAVGAGHLTGEKGLINLLRLKGYTVEPVKN